MDIIKPIRFIVLLFCLIFSCKEQKDDINTSNHHKTKPPLMKKWLHPAVYFEIPVVDMKRAMKFYNAVFNVEFEKDTIDNNEMALFPSIENNSGISGALVKGEIYRPSQTGVLLYFKTNSIERTLALVHQNSGKILLPQTNNGNSEFVAEFEDSEGNRIALYMKVD